MTDVVACGWYTPDYHHWVGPLVDSLEAFGNPHDFVPARKIDGGWERNTLQMADQIMLAMDRHPDKTIVFLNVDAIVRGSLAPLAEEVKADVGVSLHANRRRLGRYNHNLHAVSGTMVFRPTPGARDFAAAWSEVSSVESRYGDTDQFGLVFAIAKSTRTTFQPLSRRWWSRKGDPEAIVLHDRAGAHQKRISLIQRYLHRRAA